MIERSVELPDNDDRLKALALEALHLRPQIRGGSSGQKDGRAGASVAGFEPDGAGRGPHADERRRQGRDRAPDLVPEDVAARLLLGKSSEKPGADEVEQQSFAFEELDTCPGEIDARLAAKSLAKASARAQPRKTLRDKPRFPSHLERVEEVMEPEIPSAFEGKERVKIGEDESIRLDVVRARFRLIVTIRPKCACKEPTAILQASAPEHNIEAGLPTDALLAQVAVSKYADGVELNRSLMTQWMGAVGFPFELLAAFILARIGEGKRIFADETTLPTLDRDPFDRLRGRLRRFAGMAHLRQRDRRARRRPQRQAHRPGADGARQTAGSQMRRL